MVYCPSSFGFSSPAAARTAFASRPTTATIAMRSNFDMGSSNVGRRVKCDGRQPQPGEGCGRRRGRVVWAMDVGAGQVRVEHPQTTHLVYASFGPGGKGSAGKKSQPAGPGPQQ